MAAPCRHSHQRPASSVQSSEDEARQRTIGEGLKYLHQLKSQSTDDCGQPRLTAGNAIYSLERDGTDRERMENVAELRYDKNRTDCSDLIRACPSFPVTSARNY